MYCIIICIVKNVKSNELNFKIYCHVLNLILHYAQIVITGQLEAHFAFIISTKRTANFYANADSTKIIN